MLDCNLGNGCLMSKSFFFLWSMTSYLIFWQLFPVMLINFEYMYFERAMQIIFQFYANYGSQGLSLAVCVHILSICNLCKFRTVWAAMLSLIMRKVGIFTSQYGEHVLVLILSSETCPQITWRATLNFFFPIFAIIY